MCGFIGYSIIKNEKVNYVNNKFETYFDDMKHRGPDFSEKVFYKNEERLSNFGFCRLSIQDLDPSSNKIFHNDNFCLLYNGEVYNVEQLKKKYYANKIFVTKTDTELLFNLILDYGFEKIREIEGIFSIVFINIKKNKITLIRDYTGTKPLFFYFKNKNIYFSSEAWFLYSISNKELDIDACNFYFRFGFTPKDKTLVKDVFKVKPNSINHFYLNSGKFEEKKIVNNLYNSNSTKLKNKFEIKKMMENSIEKNMIGNKNIGVFLSGGLDSSIISILSKRINQNVEAYTSIYDTESELINEDYAITKKLCKEFSIKLNVKVITKHEMFNGDEFLNALKYMDEPIANLNYFSSFKQSEMAKMNNTDIILTGDGADEIFGGYRKYNILHLAHQLRMFSLFNKKIKKYKFMKNEFLPNHIFNKLSEKFMLNIFKNEFYEHIKQSESHLYNEKEFKNKLITINHFDLNNWLTDEHNSKLDKATMANSVEGRVPFQDISILNEYNLENINSNCSILKNKIFLREAFTELPEYILKRKKKGWFLPEQNLLNDFFKKNIFDIFAIQHSNSSVFNYKKIYEYYFTQKIEKLPRYEFITILFFEIWYKRMINC